MNLQRIFIVLFFINTILCFDVFAGDISNKTKELTGLQKRIKTLAQSVNDLKSKQKSLIRELKKLDKQYGFSVVQLKKTQNQVKKIAKLIKDNQREIVFNQEKIASQKKALVNLVKAAYGMGRNEKLKFMLNQQDTSVSGRMMVYYEYLNKAKLEKIKQIDTDMLVLHELELQHVQQAALLERELQQKTKVQAVLLQTKVERKVVLGKINKKFSSKKQQLNRFKKNEKKLKLLITSLQQVMGDFPFDEGVVKPFAKLKGRLPWPVRGRLLKKFGERRSDSQWDGVLIKAKEGTEIRAITRGRVVYADWLRGYGLLTIIDHGKGYMTLYAFTQSLYKGVGDWVDAGVIIASVGVSGGQADAGLYFGIRKKGKPVNPVKWCRKLRHGKVG